MSVKLNPAHAGVKRIMAEFKELTRAPDDSFYAAPCEDNLFEWHFTIRGAEDTEYEEGLYHGRILLPPQYPFSPPDIMMSTPSGRFEINKKICLSISGYHPKNWQPSWSIRTVLIALIAFFPTKPNGAIGSLDYKKSEKRMYARKSREWQCDRCKKKNREILPDLSEEEKQARKLKPKPDIPLALLTTISPDATLTTSPTKTTDETSPVTSEHTSTSPETQTNSSGSSSATLSTISSTTASPSNSSSSNTSVSDKKIESISTQNKPKNNTKDTILSHLIVILTIAILAILARKFFFTPSVNPLRWEKD